MFADQVVIDLENVDLKHKSVVYDFATRRVQALGVGGMYQYMHNPYYSHFSKGHAKYCLTHYEGKDFLITAKYVNMFGKIYDRLSGVPFCGDKDLELSFLRSIIKSRRFQDYQFNDVEIEYYGLREIFGEFTVNGLDYYTNVKEKRDYVSRSKWRSHRGVNRHDKDGFKEITHENFPDVVELFHKWKQIKYGQGKFSEKFFLRFFDAVEKGKIGFDDIMILGCYYEGQLIFCNIYTKNSPTVWRIEMQFWTDQGSPEKIHKTVRNFALYMSVNYLTEIGVERTYIAGSRNGISKKCGVLRHKMKTESGCLNYYRATNLLIE